MVILIYNNCCIVHIYAENVKFCNNSLEKIYFYGHNNEKKRSVRFSYPARMIECYCGFLEQQKETGI